MNLIYAILAVVLIMARGLKPTARLKNMLKHVERLFDQKEMAVSPSPTLIAQVETFATDTRPVPTSTLTKTPTATPSPTSTSTAEPTQTSTATASLTATSLRLQTPTRPHDISPVIDVTQNSLTDNSATEVKTNAQLNPIQPENADQVVELATWGRGNIRSVNYSSDGNWVVVGTSTGAYIHQADDLFWNGRGPDLELNGSLEIWDISNQTLLHRLSPGTEAVTDIVFSADGTFFISGSENGVVRLWGIE